jgi:phosphoenolpyruvate synthase/pyruvate phosphate dikinase
MRSEQRQDSARADALTLLPLADARCRATDFAGGKAAALARLVPTLPDAIPSAWVLPSAAARDLLAKASDAEATEWMPELQTAIERALPHHPNGYAVRSSATDEDSAVRSFAGQYETVLAVRDPGDVAEAVLTCVRSGSSDRIRAYRRASGTDDSDGDAPAVLIQGMVAAERSGVAFTIHPVTGARQTVLNANYGLGDLLVSGAVTPDTFVVDELGRIVQTTLGTKRRMTVLSHAGLEDLPVPEGLRERLCLLDSDVAAVVAAAKACEGQLGFAVDMEWAISRERVFVLQARPVTGLGPDPGHR